MSKTRRNIGANRRHFGGGKDSPENNDHRIDRFLKKMKNSSNITNRKFSDDNDLERIDHTNYQDLLDNDDE